MYCTEPTLNFREQAISLKIPSPLLLVRQLEAIRVSLFSFVFLRKNLFKPMRLSLRRFLVNDSRVLKHDELLAATITPKRAHFLEAGCPLFGLSFLDRHCFHRLIFYPASCVRYCL